MVRKAEDAGFKALVVTVDRPEQGCRRSNFTNKFVMPTHMRLVILSYTASYVFKKTFALSVVQI